MLIYLAADHRGMKLKEAVKNYLKESGYEISDLGNDKYDESDDYPDFAAMVAEKVRLNSESLGILICGSGAGVDIAANKYPGIRSVLAISPDHAAAAKTDDNTNVLSLAADYMDEKTAKQVVAVWIQTPFSGSERHLSRIAKISEIENKIKEGNL